MHVLPSLSASAAQNMAYDLLLLEQYPYPETPRFRHYGWERPSFSFGYSQRWSPKHKLIMEINADLVRRPTGGGLVDHLHDWTYSLVIPPNHAIFREKAITSYQKIHEILAQALVKQGYQVSLQPCRKTCDAQNSTIDEIPAPTDICFETAEVYDVVHPNGAKVAGAAQKRNRQGLLFQGSINQQAVSGVNWTNFQEDFTESVTHLLGTGQKAVDTPAYSPQALEELIAKFSSTEWNQRLQNQA